MSTSDNPSKKRGLWLAVIIIIGLLVGYGLFGTDDGSDPANTTQQ